MNHVAFVRVGQGREHVADETQAVGDAERTFLKSFAQVDAGAVSVDQAGVLNRQQRHDVLVLEMRHYRRLASQTVRQRR